MHCPESKRKSKSFYFNQSSSSQSLSTPEDPLMSPFLTSDKHYIKQKGRNTHSIGWPGRQLLPRDRSGMWKEFNLVMVVADPDQNCPGCKHNRTAWPLPYGSPAFEHRTSSKEGCSCCYPKRFLNADGSSQQLEECPLRKREPSFLIPPSSRH